MSLAVELSKRVARYHRLITGALFVAALIVLCIFPSFDRRTEIEEHGLIAGYATSAFDAKWQTRLKACINDIEAEKDLPSAIDRSLKEAGLEAFHLNFSTPLGQRSLTYTLAESRRADSRESLVVASNWTAPKAPAKFSWGVGVGVTLARYLRTVHWLSRDVFVVFLDMDLAYGASARAWLQNYLGGLSELRRGVLRQAVVLQIKNGATSLLLDVEGINGMVPNQDLVNSYSVSARDKGGLLVRPRDAWESVLHHARNGGVHSSHAPFLELQVPAFTIRGVLDALTMSIEGLVRCMSNALQQLHHSFNFYFFTGPNSHISNGFYLYPVFAMQLLLISFLGTAPAYRDIRSLLVGLGSVFAISAASGSAMLLMALSEASRSGSEGLLCVRRPQLEDRRQLAQSWLAAGGAVAACGALALRRYAFAVYSEEGAKLQGVQLPCPLWEAVRVASGFALLAVLAPVTIYSWSLAVPLTILCVPSLVMVRPMNLRKRPFRSLFLLTFLAGNAFLLLVHPTVPVSQNLAREMNGKKRSSLLSHLDQLPASLLHFYEKTIVPSVPRHAQKFLPWQLVQWLQQGQLKQALSSDLLVGLFEAARDYKCVGGMLFPIFCFAYWPFLMLIVLIAGVLPAQRVEDEAMSLSQLRVQILLVISLLMAGVAGGVLWRSYSSHGLGELQW